MIGRVFDVLANLDIVTIGAINGYAVGGGWSWALAFDFCLAVEAAEFWVPEVDMHVPYRGAPAMVLAARLGPWRAKEAILMCRHYKAAELLALGVINRIVKPEELMPAAQRTARKRWRRSRPKPSQVPSATSTRCSSGSDFFRPSAITISLGKSRSFATTLSS